MCGMCGINGINWMGTWVVSTICCAAEVDPSASEWFKIAKQGSRRVGRGVAVSAHRIPGVLGYFGRAVAVVALVVLAFSV